VSACDVSCYRQAKTDASGGPTTGRLKPPEGRNDVGKLIAWDAWAGVVDMDINLINPTFDHQGGAASEAHGIV
jgi:hypothetical protein